MKEIKVIINNNSVVDVINLPKGYKLSILDYDVTEPYSEGELEEFDGFELDKDGDWYQKIEWNKND